MLSSSQASPRSIAAGTPGQPPPALDQRRQSTARSRRRGTRRGARHRGINVEPRGVVGRAPGAVLVLPLQEKLDAAADRGIQFRGRSAPRPAWTWGTCPSLSAVRRNLPPAAKAGPIAPGPGLPRRREAAKGRLARFPAAHPQGPRKNNLYNFRAGWHAQSAAMGVVYRPATPFVPQGVPPNCQTFSFAGPRRSKGFLRIQGRCFAPLSITEC